MDFQVNGETYFVTLGEKEQEWLVFVEGPAGTRRVPVYDDAPEFSELTVIEDRNTRKVVN